MINGWEGSTRVIRAIILQALTDAIESGDFSYFEKDNIDLQFFCSAGGWDIDILVDRIKSGKIIQKNQLTKARRAKGYGESDSTPTDYGELLEIGGEGYQRKVRACTDEIEY